MTEEGTFELRIDEFSKLPTDRKFDAPINGLVWQVLIQSLASHRRDPYFYLRCYKKNDESSGNCRATVKFHIVSQKESVDGIVSHRVDNFNHGWTRLERMSRDMLLNPNNGFIKNDIVIVRVYVTDMMQANEKAKSNKFVSSISDPPDGVLIVGDKRIPIHKTFKSATMIEEGTFELRIDQFSKIRTSTTLDAPTYIQGLDWKVLVQPASYDRNIKFYLKCNGTDGESSAKCHAIVKFNIVSQNGVVDDTVSHIVHDFSIDWTRLESMRHDVLFNPNYGFIKNDTIIVRVHVTPEVPQDVGNSHEFVSSISDPPDGVLVVEDNRIPIHKTYLSFYSDFFKTMFRSEFKEGHEDEIVLEEIESEEMLELLTVIYPSNASITEKNIETILKLADRFIMPSVLKQCKKVLRTSTNINGALKLFLAQRYNFTDLQTQLAQRYKTMDDVKKLKSEPEYKLLNSNTLALILNSIGS